MHLDHIHSLFLPPNPPGPPQKLNIIDPLFETTGETSAYQVFSNLFKFSKFIYYNYSCLSLPICFVSSFHSVAALFFLLYTTHSL